MNFAELRLFIEDAPVGAAMFDREMRYVAFSHRWLVNHRIGSIKLGRSHYDVFPEIPERWKEVHRRALAGEVIREDEDRFERADAEAIWLRWEVRPWRDSEGAIGGIIIFADDITPQKRGEEALQEALARQRLAQSAAHIGIWDWEIPANRTYLNDEYYDLCGLPKDACLTYEDFLSLVHPEDRAAVDDAHRGALAGGGHIALDFRILRADTGAVRWVSSKGEVSFDAAGRAVRAMGAVYDITERKEMERALRESNQRKTEFLATLAHELRNPLTPISNAINVMLRLSTSREPAAREKKVAVMHMAQRQIDHLSRLVDDLLDMTRISHGKISLERKHIDLAESLAQAVELIQPGFEAKGQSLALDAPGAPLPVFADPVRLTQVFANLLNNAARYTDHGGCIELTARRDGEEAVVTVRDNGDGIPPDMLTSIFEMFTQGRKEETTSRRGLGVGLALARSLIGMHGGAIEAQSEGLGRGSAFTVRLPLAEGE